MKQTKANAQMTHNHKWKHLLVYHEQKDPTHTQIHTLTRRPSNPHPQESPILGVCKLEILKIQQSLGPEAIKTLVGCSNASIRGIWWQRPPLRSLSILLHC